MTHLAKKAITRQSSNTISVCVANVYKTVVTATKMAATSPCELRVMADSQLRKDSVNSMYRPTVYRKLKLIVKGTVGIG